MPRHLREPDKEHRSMSRKVWPGHRIVRRLEKTAARAQRSDDGFNSFRSGGELEAQGIEDFGDLGFGQGD